ncbi:MAG: hypothetical protein AB2826_19490 [Candidatus Thiodiazotropha sp.]
MLSRNVFVHEKTGVSAPRPYRRKSPRALVLALCTLILTSGTVVAEEPQIDWKTLAEYMAMDRDTQRKLIWDTLRIVMRKLAETDIDRAECVSGLFDFGTEEGQNQFYNLKAFLSDAASENLFPGWKAQQVAAYVMKTHLCPADSPTELSLN